MFKTATALLSALALTTAAEVEVGTGLRGGLSQAVLHHQRMLANGDWYYVDQTKVRPSGYLMVSLRFCWRTFVMGLCRARTPGTCRTWGKLLWSHKRRSPCVELAPYPPRSNGMIKLKVAPDQEAVSLHSKAFYNGGKFEVAIKSAAAMPGVSRTLPCPG
jgi:hypothetical protein